MLALVYMFILEQMSIIICIRYQGLLRMSIERHSTCICQFCRLQLVIGVACCCTRHVRNIWTLMHQCFFIIILCLCVPVCACVSVCVPVCACLCNGLQGCAGVCSGVPVCAGMCRCVPVCAEVCRHVQWCAGVCRGVQMCAGVWLCVVACWAGTKRTRRLSPGHSESHGSAERLSHGFTCAQAQGSEK
jgi:hypothetical protein